MIRIFTPPVLQFKVITFLFLSCILSDAQTLPGTVTTSWVGNSFGGGSGSRDKLIGNLVTGMWVKSDGTVFLSGYDEIGRGNGVYKGGDMLGHFNNPNFGFGQSTKCITGDDKYVYYGDEKGVYRFSHQPSTNSNATLLSGKHIGGIACRNGELYIGNDTDSSIEVFSTTTLQKLRGWKFTNPGPMAIDKDGNVWVIQIGDGPDGQYYGKYLINGPNKLLCYSSTGTLLKEINDGFNPTAVSFDNNERLMVAVGGRNYANNYVRIYNNLLSTPTLVSTFGKEKGIYDDKPGEAGPLKFHWIKGVGMDVAGNIYVSYIQSSWWGTTVDAYSPDGTRLWQLYGHHYIDVIDIDPKNENLAYGKESVYSMDWSQSAGKEGTFKGMTFSDASFPEDPRNNINHGPSHRIGFGIVYLQGKKFYVSTNQGGSAVEMFRFSPEQGEIGIPSTMIYLSTRGTEYPVVQPPFAFNDYARNLIWHDSNGDGKYALDEYSANDKPIYTQAWCFDSSSDFWTIWETFSRTAPFYKIRRYPFQGFDGAGNPIYSSATKVEEENMPDEFQVSSNKQQVRILYLKDIDVMYLTGQTTDNTYKVVRYDAWSKPLLRKRVWGITLPVNDPSFVTGTYGGGSPLVVKVAGDYVFVCYGIGWIRVYNKDNGSYLGLLKPNNLVITGDGAIDSKYGMTAYKRSNGEYVLFTESAGGNAANMIRWCPTGNCNTITAANDDQNKEGANTILMFPNPASSQVTLSMKLKEASEINLSIVDATGRVMKSLYYPSSSTIEETIEVSDFPKGLYMINTVVNAEMHKAQKFIIK